MEAVAKSRRGRGGIELRCSTVRGLTKRPFLWFEMESKERETQPKSSKDLAIF